MSTVKSMTAMLVGAAVHDGAIKSIDEPLTKYLPAADAGAHKGGRRERSWLAILPGLDRTSRGQRL
jgi:CubicO group peptidase (beta-lactamase class C family)